jgi:rhodanese-related sulfurtransferase
MSAESTNAESMKYAGDVAPEDAYAALAAEEDAVLVDVRTAAEWSYVGLPDLSALGKRVICVEWQRFPDGAINGDFVEQLQDAGLPDGAPIYFLCRSGVRSIAAAEAAAGAGLGTAYNVLEGFEGPHDEHGHRAVSGWKNAGLPWRQG